MSLLAQPAIDELDEIVKKWMGVHVDIGGFPCRVVDVHPVLKKVRVEGPGFAGRHEFYMERVLAMNPNLFGESLPQCATPAPSRCTCGSAKAGSPAHSSWCDL